MMTVKPGVNSSLQVKKKEESKITFHHIQERIIKKTCTFTSQNSDKTISKDCTKQQVKPNI